MDIQDPINNAIEEYHLHQNYPNPFNPVTTIEFNLSKDNEVTLKFFNLPGEEVATLISASLHSGQHRYQWHALDYPGGIYYYQIQAGYYRKVKK